MTSIGSMRLSDVNCSNKRVCRRDEGDATFVLGVNTTTNSPNTKVEHSLSSPVLLPVDNVGLLPSNTGGDENKPIVKWYYPSSSKDEPSQISVAAANLDVDMNIDEGSAKRQIQLICRTPACWRGESDQKIMACLLQRFPVLASQEIDWDFNLFWEHGNEWSSPLSFLIVAGASLEIVKAVYKLHPPALWQPSGIRRDLPLHFACRFGVSEDIIMFILSKFPVAATVSNLSGMLPIHCAMGKKDISPYGKFQHARLETVRLLVEVFPQSLLKGENDKHYTPLQLAFNHGYNFPVVDYMIRKLPDQVEEFRLIAGCYHKLFEVKIDLAESELAAKLLPKVRSFRCQPTSWEMGGLVRLLSSLEQSSQTKEFQASNLSGDMLQDGTMSSALSSLMDQNTPLETLSLEMRKRDENDTRSESFFLCSLPRIFQHNRRLKTLKLSNFSATSGALLNLIASKNAPEILHLNKFLVIQDDKEDICNCLRPHMHSRLGKLVISGCRFLSGEKNPDGWFASSLLVLLNCVARLPRLTDLALRLCIPEKIDITDPLVHILQYGSLEHLQIRGLVLQMDALCAALMANTTLRRLDDPTCLHTRVGRSLLAKVLENNNATLQTVRMGYRSTVSLFNDEGYKKVRYYARLNQFGRATIRTANATKQLVVKLLHDADTASAAVAADHELDEKLGMYYGLLRESPGLWA